MNVFDRHDSFADIAHVRSHLVHRAGPDPATVAVSVVIPTYRRPALLLEALASALGQDVAPSLEVVIVSNDPDVPRNDAIARALPRDPPHPVRMYVNESNVGMFPNWNRGIELARGAWVTILNDDDVLHAKFLSEMMQRIRRRPEVDGLVCRTGFLDRRSMSPHAAPPASVIRKAWRAIARRRFDTDRMVRIGPRQLFFGNELSNTLGFLFRRELACTLGGFRAEDAPSADYLFYARMAAGGGLFLLDRVLADVGIGDNESLRHDTMVGFMVQGDRMRQDMVARGHVPRSWLRMSPLIVATAVAETNAFWHGRLDRDAIGAELGMSLPPPSRARLNLLRLRHNAL